jgi:hypothetical protein
LVKKEECHKNVVELHKLTAITQFCNHKVSDEQLFQHRRLFHNGRAFPPNSSDNFVAFFEAPSIVNFSTKPVKLIFQ